MGLFHFLDMILPTFTTGCVLLLRIVFHLRGNGVCCYCIIVLMFYCFVAIVVFMVF